jgi:hypothetical protein
VSRELFRTLVWVTIYSIAMGFLEAAVVVYLRALYYPQGFAFPLVPIAPELARVELIREVATVVMLLAVGWIAGKNLAQRFALFVLSFAVWDIFYYLALRLTIGWPESLFTWDILFLVPVPWVGPVASAVFVAVLMIVLALAMLVASGRANAWLTREEFGVFTVASVVLATAWAWDFAEWALREHSFGAFLGAALGGEIFAIARTYVPQVFSWGIYSLGVVIWCGGVAWYWRRVQRGSQEPGVQT